jgi:hypothetical protein
MTIKVETVQVTTHDQDREFWSYYAKQMEDIQSLAVQAHQAPQEHFRYWMNDEDLTRYAARNDTGELVGLSMMTSYLPSWAGSVSPEYFERHFPVEFAQRRIFYICFVTASERGAFQELIATMLAEINAVDGIASLDWSDHNRIVRHLDRASAHVIRRLNPTMREQVIDTQQYMLYTFAPGSGRTT